MTSSNDTNNTTENFLKALQEYKPREVKPVVIKLTYDIDTKLVNGLTFDETDNPWIEITREQYNAGIQHKRLRVVDGKLEEVTKITTKRLSLVEGNTWFTKDNNMLIIANERGWDERGNN